LYSFITQLNIKHTEKKTEKSHLPSALKLQKQQLNFSPIFPPLSEFYLLLMSLPLFLSFFFVLSPFGSSFMFSKPSLGNTWKHQQQQ
jgi:hypothetical protein